MNKIPAQSLPSNPHYGEGKFIRSLVITTPAHNQIALAMEDIHHAFQLHFTHDGRSVTGIEARWERYPMSGCIGAPDALQSMIGCPLGGDLREIARYANSRQNCSHLFDMLTLGISHAWHQREDRRYDVIVPDAAEGLMDAYLELNGETVLHFKLKDHEYIVEPEHYQGVSVLRGFSSWAKDALSQQEFDCAFIMQRGLFVSQARRADFADTIGKPADLSGPPAGACFMAQPGRYENSVRVDPGKDLSSANPDDLLQFFEPGTPVNS